jgi:serine/threonine protein kinase
MGPEAISGSGVENYDEIPFEEIQIEEVIGNGAFGKVYRAMLWGQPVAVKMLRPSEKVDTADIAELITKEAEIMRSLRHPNIVEFMGVAREKSGSIAIVTELLECGGLDEYLSKRKKLSWKRYFEIAKVTNSRSTV